jgi:hypothetical protein
MFAVIENTPGYLPEADEPFYSDSRTECQNYAQSLADEYRADPFFTVRGNKRDGYTVHDISKMHDLGRVIEVVEVS